MGFMAAVEASTQIEMADQIAIQRKIASGPAAPPYEYYATCVENWDTLGNSALRCNKYLRRHPKQLRNTKPQVKARVYALDGLPIDIEAEVVEVSTPMGVSKATKIKYSNDGFKHTIWVL
ncbi:hypothetical protein M9H77_07136 [Catharanthus roseus]|uniref:Uncharacterized protein n=1 Tax=Catharanthus roseus TaxID=4058 RepID=A0ACC0BU39_CATRO|nr:hypothetical protein M9H77_07136 [Catharanthus roseus]